MRTFFHKVIMTIAGCTLTGCLTAQHGAVCFTFDDYHGENWLKAVPLFQKYDAHASFFIKGEITPEKIEVMKKLQTAGHTVGLHALHHKAAIPYIYEKSAKQYIDEEIMPQLNVCEQNGLKIRSFAYPYNRRDEETDRMLFAFFDHLRAGPGSSGQPLLYPARTLPDKSYLGGTGIGTRYKSDLNSLKHLLTQAAETDSILVFYSHDIYPKAEHIHMPVEWLEELLAHARKSGMKIIGFDELNSLKNSYSSGKAKQ